jgi:hypothetical protein
MRKKILGKKNRDANRDQGQLLQCIDYLHGDVIDGEFRAACQYEYARESKVLCDAAELAERDPARVVEQVILDVEGQKGFGAANWIGRLEWSCIWQCVSFPAKSWNQLSEAERTELLRVLPLSTSVVRPLPMEEVIFLTPYLDRLKGIAGKARAERKEALAAGRPPQKVYPILELPNTPFVQVLLSLDFSKSKARLLQEIGKWLDCPKNKARFQKHQRKTEVGTEKEAKDRLKDLAAWRLYRELGCDEALKFAQTNRLCGPGGVARKFHDWRQGQTKKIRPNEADLYGEESGFLKAKARALSYRANLIPWEFGKIAEDDEKATRRLAAAFRKVLKEVKRISRKNS